METADYERQKVRRCRQSDYRILRMASETPEEREERLEKWRQWDRQRRAAQRGQDRSAILGERWVRDRAELIRFWRMWSKMVTRYFSCSLCTTTVAILLLLHRPFFILIWHLLRALHHSLPCFHLQSSLHHCNYHILLCSRLL